MGRRSSRCHQLSDLLEQLTGFLGTRHPDVHVSSVHRECPEFFLDGRFLEGDERRCLNQHVSDVLVLAHHCFLDGLHRSVSDSVWERRWKTLVIGFFESVLNRFHYLFSHRYSSSSLSLGLWYLAISCLLYTSDAADERS